MVRSHDPLQVCFASGCYSFYFPIVTTGNRALTSVNVVGETLATGAGAAVLHLASDFQFRRRSVARVLAHFQVRSVRSKAGVSHDSRWRHLFSWRGLCSHLLAPAHAPVDIFR